MNFIHLRNYSEYSLTRGTNTVKDLVKAAKKENMGALALTDYNAMFGVLQFYKETKNSGIKPIIGIDITIEQDESENNNTYQLLLLAKNANGYKKITEIISKAYTENRREDFVALKEEWLSELEDVIVLSGAKQGLIGQKILQGKMDEALIIAQQFKDAFGVDFYMELQRDATEDETIYMDGAVEICQKLNIAPVATHPCYFPTSEDALANEVKHCNGLKLDLLDAKRKRIFNKEMYIKTVSEMEDLFSDLPQALENTFLISKKCNIDLQLDVPKLPEFKTPNGEEVDDYFVNLSKKGLEERLEFLFPNEIERNVQRPKYEERLNWEMNIIKKMKFPGYFLIVADFINWAKGNDIPVGPGRGSGAGSLVAYSLKITDLDPIKYGLLFERFLNPDRVSMPDFDVDFCQSRRDEVINYVRKKYGSDKVSQIGTFGTMAARAAIRDVARTLKMHYELADGIAKMINIPAANPKKLTLKDAIWGNEEKEVPPNDGLIDRYENEIDVKKVIDIALKLEGQVKQIGTHAGGVIISPTKLTDFTPMYRLKPDDELNSQFDKDDVEVAGLVKFDFLGLTNLTIIQNAVKLINKRHPDVKLNLNTIDINDQNVYKNIFATGNTGEVFQFESKGMRNILQKAKPTCLEDLIAIVSLYRPGPMEIIPEWLASKEMPESERPYPHPLLRDILKETYGYMVYQEQVMQCAQVLAGYSLGEADILRRAMGKKKVEEMQKQRAKFIEGAAKNNVPAEKANELFDLIDKFSGYGFNKSHAAVYSLLSYQTGYLKYNYIAEFLTANLNAHIETLDTDKIAVLIHDAKLNGLNILPPDINKSNVDFNIESENSLRYALGAIKGVGQKAATVIEEDRQKNGPYKDFVDFLGRVGKGNVNKRVLIALIKSGAFDSLHNNRAQIYEMIEKGLDYVAKLRKKQMENASVFGDSLSDIIGEVAEKKVKGKKKPAPEAIPPTYDEVAPWDELTQLKSEKEVLGYYLMSNPFTQYYSKELGGLPAAAPLDQLKDFYMRDFNEVYIGALVEEINWWKSKKGAFVKISDGISTMDVRVFADFIEENQDWFKKDAFVSMKVKLDLDLENDSLLLSCSQGFNFEQTRKLNIDKIFVGSENNPELIEKFNEILAAHTPKENDSVAQIIFCLPDENGRRAIKHKTGYVSISEKLFTELKGIYSDQWVKVLAKKDSSLIDFPAKKNANKGGGKYPYKKKGGSALAV